MVPVRCHARYWRAYLADRRLVLKWGRRLIIAALALGLAVYVVRPLPSFQNCIKEEKGTSPYEALHNKSGSFLRAHARIRLNLSCTFGAAERNEGGLNILAALAIAIFTFTLWRSTDLLWESSEKALRTTERAFVLLDGFNYELTTADKVGNVSDLPDLYQPQPHLYVTRFAVQPRWKNGGNTQTRNLMINVDYGGPEGTFPPEYKYRNPDSRFFLAKAVEPGTFIEMTYGAQALVYHGIRGMAVEPLVVIWGTANYEDVFGHRHFIEWCYQVRFECHDGRNLRASFIQWGDYNRTDDDYPG